MCSDLTWLFEEEPWAVRILPEGTVYSKHSYYLWLCISSIDLQMQIRRRTEQFDYLTGLSWAAKNFKTHLCFWVQFPLTVKLKDFKYIYTWSITLNNSKATVTFLEDPTFSNSGSIEIKVSASLNDCVFISQVILLFSPHFWGQL